MKKNKFIDSFLILILTVSVFTVSLPRIGFAQDGTAKTAEASDLQKRLADIEAQVEKRQKELGIPGLSLAIVKDGRILMSKGFGYKDLENKVPVTPDTQFAIGSATKAFTGLSVLMLQDEEKLSLTDHPKKHLSYFKINDEKINEKIQIRDLLSHSSGLNRTDLGWITGKLNEEEIIRVAAEAKPIAGLREQFLYQNVMYLAAGKIVGNVSGKPWSEFVPERIFNPLGMTNSTVNVNQMLRAKDYSFGYEYNFDTKRTKKLPTREISAIAPAGSINSSANDMSKWLRFILNGGEANGKQLVSKEGFAEWIKPQMKISPDGSVSYGLGWFVQDWSGKKVVQHGGNIDGFNSMVALMPEENLGFVLLTNVSASSLGGELMQIVWSGILEDKKTAKPLTATAKKEVGKYRLVQANLDIDVKIEDGKLVAVVPGQPTYILENVKDRRYRFSNAPAGFFLTFEDTEALLEQPNGKATLVKQGAKSESKNAPDDSAKSLIGNYQAVQQKERTIQIKDIDGKPSLVVDQQPPYPLEKRDDGNFGSPGLPPTFYVKAKSDSNGKISGITMVQPNGEFEFNKIDENSAPKINITVDELLAKSIAALGGEENMRKINSRVTEFKVDAINQGVKGYGKSYQKTPNKTFSETTLTAVGKKIGWIKEHFDGTKGGEEYSFSRDEEYTGTRLADIKIHSSFHWFLDWKKTHEKAEIRRMGKVNDEEAYIVEMTPKKGSPYGVFISAKSFLPLRTNRVMVSSTSAQRVPMTLFYEDYREVDGIMIPFKVTNRNEGMGNMITYITKVKHNVKVSDSKFVKKSEK